MTPQEEQLLEGLIQRVNQTQLPEKDQEAEQLLRQSFSQNPDAIYILCQTVLVQQYALEQAQKKIASFEQQPPQNLEHHTSFLGNLFGGGDRQAPPPPPPSQYAPVNTYGPPPPPYGAPQYAPAPPMGGGFGGGGFLQGALQTAAGVAAGELAFRGIEDLMHGFGHEAGYGNDRILGGNFGDRPEIVNNNYYGDASPGGHGGDLSDRLQAADGGSGLSPDIEDRRDGFADTSSGDSAQDNFADTSDDSSFDDGGDFSSDDSGSNDDSGF